MEYNTIYNLAIKTTIFSIYGVIPNIVDEYKYSNKSEYRTGGLVLQVYKYNFFKHLIGSYNLIR